MLFECNDVHSAFFHILKVNFDFPWITNQALVKCNRVWCISQNGTFKLLESFTLCNTLRMFFLRMFFFYSTSLNTFWPVELIEITELGLHHWLIEYLIINPPLRAHSFIVIKLTGFKMKKLSWRERFGELPVTFSRSFESASRKCG